MISFALVSADAKLREGDTPTYSYRSGIIHPYSKAFNADAYRSIGMTREEHQAKANITLGAEMVRCHQWSKGLPGGRPVLWSDNPGFDFAWLNHSFHASIGSNPYGWSCRRIGDLYAGAMGKGQQTGSWRRWRRAPHSHDPYDDALGNAQALVTIDTEFELGLF